MILTLVGCVRKARRAASVGRTPTCWQDTYVRPPRKMAAVAKLCAWVTESPRPRLLDQPLLGHCLDAMFDDGRPRPERDEPATERARHPWSAEETATRPRAGATVASAGLGPARPETSEATSHARSTRPRSLPRTAWPAPQGAELPARPDNRPGSLPVLPAPGDTSVRAVYSAPTCADRGFLTRLAGDGESSSSAPVRRAPDTSPRPRRGPEVRAVPAPDGVRPRPATLRAARRLASPTYAATLDARVLHQLQRAAAASGGHDVVDDRRVEHFARALAGPCASQDLLERITRLPRPYRTHAQTDAPTVTASQPYLEPPPAPYAPPIPVASASLRRGAQRERDETSPTADLDLTEKISRILDDEARRHGIDV